MSAPTEIRFAYLVWKLIAAMIAIAIAVPLAIGAVRYLNGARLDRFQPARSGDVVVIEKISHGQPGNEERLLRVLLEVPAASPADAAKIPTNTPDRDALIGARRFEIEVPVEREKWDAVTPGAHVRAMYQLNLRRTKAFVSTLYLDALAPPR